MAKKSMIAKAKRKPKFGVRGLQPLLRVRPAARLHAPLRRCAASASGSAPSQGELPGVTKSSW